MCFEGFDHTIPPVLENADFYLWKGRMKSFILSTDFKMWDVFEKDSDFKPKVNWTEEDKSLFYLNLRAMQILHKSLSDNDYQKIKHCSRAIDIWNTLDTMYASNQFLDVKAVQSSLCAPCESTVDELLDGDVVEASISKERVDLRLEDSEAEENEVPKLETSELQDMYNELHVEFCKLAKEILGLRKRNRELEELIPSSTTKESKVPLIKEDFSKDPEISKVNKHRVFEKKTDHHNSDKKSDSEHHPIICHYCGRTGHISHTCNFKRNLNVRNKYIWIPKGQVRSSANYVGSKYKWVPKLSSSALLVQKRSRVPPVSKKRTRGDVTAATAWFNHKKQCATTRNKDLVSGISYHRVPFNYPEKDKRERMSQLTWRKPANPVSPKKVLQAKDKYKRSPWVSKGLFKVEACNSKISYANVRWDY